VVGIGVILTFLVLGALEMLTARLPGGVPLAGQMTSDSPGGGPWQDFLDSGAQSPGADQSVAPVSEPSEREGAVAVAQGSWR